MAQNTPLLFSSRGSLCEQKCSPKTERTCGVKKLVTADIISIQGIMTSGGERKGLSGVAVPSFHIVHETGNKTTLGSCAFCLLFFSPLADS